MDILIALLLHFEESHHRHSRASTLDVTKVAQSMLLMYGVRMQQLMKGRMVDIFSNIEIFLSP